MHSSRSATPRLRTRSERGITLLEVTVCLALLAGSVLASVTSFDGVSRATAAYDRRARATAMAEREIEALRSFSYAEVGLAASSPDFEPEFEGRRTVLSASALVDPQSIVTEASTQFEVTRGVTWADVSAENGRFMPGAYKRLTVQVRWDDGTRRDSVRLDSGVSPFQQPESCAERSTDGDGGSLIGVVNAYAVGLSDVSPGAGVIELNDSGRGIGNFRAGDALLVIQMEGPSAGRYEFARATGNLANNRISVEGDGADGALVNPYDAAAGFQVVRVPTYRSATLDGVRGVPYDGDTGGVVSIDVAGRAVLGAGVDARAMGFSSAASQSSTDGSLVIPGGGTGKAPGGGLVILRASSVDGAGPILADAGASGDGGTVIVTTESGGLETVRVSARGTGGGGGGTVATSSTLGSLDLGADAPGTPGVASDRLPAGDVIGLGLGVGCRPLISISKSTTTPTTVSDGTGVAGYVITAESQNDVTATSMTIRDILPKGLSYLSTTSIDLKGAVRTSQSDPKTGDITPVWGGFVLPPKSSVRLAFDAAVEAGLPDGVVENSATLNWSSSQGPGRSTDDSAMSTDEDVLVRSFSCVAPWTDTAPSGRIDGVINTYHPLLGTATSGTTALRVGPASGSATQIKAGDLVLIQQVQGSSIDPGDGPDYGDGPAGATTSGTTEIGQSGRYEYVLATGPVVDGVLRVAASGTGGGLLNEYQVAAPDASTGARRVQVLRVPTYPDSRLGQVDPLPWNGAVGGVVAMDIAGTLDLAGGRINATGVGMRGGGAVGRLSTSTAVADASGTSGGAKAEGLVGSPRSVNLAGIAVDLGSEGLPGGGFGSGAPGNAGGGGSWQAGGGGGANGGSGGSGGGGKNGGSQPAGASGSPVPVSPDRLLIGGGGGATQLDVGQSARGGHGGNGGGLVMLRATELSGSGDIRADGANGLDGRAAVLAAPGVAAQAESAGGGGGGGGTVIVSSSTPSVPGLSISVRGGSGGAAGAAGGASRGGGGGGGGAVFSTSAVTTSVAPGSPGVSTGAGSPNAGAQGRSEVTTPDALVGARPGSGCRPLLAVSVSTSTPERTRVAGSLVQYSVTLANRNDRLPTSGSLIESALALVTLPKGVQFEAVTDIAVSDGASRAKGSDPKTGTSSPSWSGFTLPGRGSVTISFTASHAGVGVGRTDTAARATGTWNEDAVVGGYAPSDGSTDDVTFSDAVSTFAAVGSQASKGWGESLDDPLRKSDGLRYVSQAFGPELDASRFVDVRLDGEVVPAMDPMVGNGAMEVALDLGATAGDAVCVTAELIVGSTEERIVDLSKSGPTCVESGTISLSTGVEARPWTAAILRDLVIRIRGVSKAGLGVSVDRALVNIGRPTGVWTLSARTVNDSADGKTVRTSSVSPSATAGDGDVAVVGGVAISNNFSSSVYVDMVFDSSLPSDSTVTGGSVEIAGRAASKGATTLCWWAELRNAKGVVADLVPQKSPVCRTGAEVSQVQTVPLPIMASSALTGLVVRWYPSVTAGTASSIGFDRFAVIPSWSQP